MNLKTELQCVVPFGCLSLVSIPYKTFPLAGRRTGRKKIIMLDAGQFNDLRRLADLLLKMCNRSMFSICSCKPVLQCLETFMAHRFHQPCKKK